MAWVQLTEADIRARMTSCEIEALENAGDFTPSTDKLSVLIADVIELVRAKVRACGLNTSIGEAGTIPSELKLAAANIVRHELIGSVGGTDILGSDIRKESYEMAMKLLEKAASCDISIEGSATSSTSATSTTCITGGAPLLDFSM